jgi:hypothetical protein
MRFAPMACRFTLSFTAFSAAFHALHAFAFSASRQRHFRQMSASLPPSFRRRHSPQFSFSLRLHARLSMPAEAVFAAY